MRATSVGKSVLRNIVETYWNRSSLETFYGDNLISKKFQDIVFGEIIFD